jgi:hypothetical protein
MLGSATGARADTVQIALDTPNSNISGSTGPYAYVTVDLTSSTTATITFTSANPTQFLLADGGTAGINVNATTWTLGTVTGSNSNNLAGNTFTPGPYSNGGAGNEDGFGSFNQTINTFDGYQHSSTTVSFTITDTSGTWASAANVLADPNGYYAAAHIFVCDTVPCADGGTANNTGYAAGSVVTAVPEPATWGMMLLGFAGLGFAFRGSRRTVSFA